MFKNLILFFYKNSDRRLNQVKIGNHSAYSFGVTFLGSEDSFNLVQSLWGQGQQTSERSK